MENKTVTLESKAKTVSQIHDDYRKELLKYVKVEGRTMYFEQPMFDKYAEEIGCKKWIPLEDVPVQTKIALNMMNEARVDRERANNELDKIKNQLEEVNRIANEMEAVYDKYIKEQQLEGVRGSLFFDFSKKLHKCISQESKEKKL
jgi:hypothetical protein